MRIVSLLFCVLINRGSFCYVLCSCMRKKLVTELIRVPIKIIGICFTFWPVPKNYQKKIKIIKLYFIKKKNNKKQVGWIFVNIMVIMDLLLVMVSGFFLFFLDIILALSDFSIYVFCLCHIPHRRVRDR
jgi:hypothetical protein